MTPPSKITVSAGIDQMTNSARPSKDSSRLRLARVLDDLYHQANANVARITGITTTSMIAVELISRSRSAEAIGPCGSNTPAGEQEATRMAAPSTDKRSWPERRRRYAGLAVLLIESGGPPLSRTEVESPAQCRSRKSFCKLIGDGFRHAGPLGRLDRKSTALGTSTSRAVSSRRQWHRGQYRGRGRTRRPAHRGVC